MQMELNFASEYKILSHPLNLATLNDPTNPFGKCNEDRLKRHRNKTDHVWVYQGLKAKSMI